MPPVDTESVLRFIRIRGPVLPMQVAKEIKQNSMMAGAVLSELVSSGKLKVSKIKVGGSPLYYPPGQENRLMSFTQHLDAKDRQAYDLLRQKGLLRDDFLDPLTRVSLRALKDFAIPLTVTIDGTQQVYWKWYLNSDHMTEGSIKELLGIAKPLDQQAILPENSPPRAITQIQKEPSVTNQAPNLAAPSISGSEYEEESQEYITEATASLETIPTPFTPIEPIKPNHTQKKVKPKGQTQLNSEIISDQEKKSLPDYSNDQFYAKLESYLTTKSITIHESLCIKKSSDFECVITIPSPVGPLTYFCKAINKKRIQEGDVTAAFLHSQLAHLPGILVTSGQLTKPAHQIVENKLKGLTVLTMK